MSKRNHKFAAATGLPDLMMAPPTGSTCNGGGDFYDQIHAEIKDLRSRVDVRLKDVVSNGENEVNFLSKQLETIKTLDTDDGASFDDLRVSASAMTEHATNTREIAMARRLHGINFPDDDTIAETDDEDEEDSEESNRSEYVFQNPQSNIKNTVRQNKDAITKARERASRRFFLEDEVSLDLKGYANKNNALIPVESTRSPYAQAISDRSRNAYRQHAYSGQVPSLADGLDSPKSHQSRDPEHSESEDYSRALVVGQRDKNRYGGDRMSRNGGNYLQVAKKSSRKSQHDRARDLDRLMSSLDYLDTPKAKSDEARLTRPQRSTENRLVQVDNSDAYSEATSCATSAALSVASQSLAYKTSSLERMAQRSVTDTMSIRSDNELFASLATGKAGGAARIEKVQGRVLCDPYGDRGRFTGILVNGKPYGHGTFHYDDGRTFSGTYKAGKWHGRGRTLFVNGDFYIGEYVRDRREGAGRYEWIDGRTFDGRFVKDRREKGTYTWPTGCVYVGTFNLITGHREGFGIYKFSNGSVYTGEWLSGKYHGVGECIWPNNRWYRGEWKEGKAHGYGVEIRPDGTVRHDGLWYEDRPIRDGKEGKEKSMIPVNIKQPAKTPEDERPEKETA